MHNGRSKNGRLLYPAFPYTSYTQVTREDSDALFAYLGSLPPAVAPNLPHALRFPYQSQAALAVWRALFFSPGVYEADAARGRRVEPRCLPGQGPGPLRGLPHRAQCPGRQRPGPGPGRRPDPHAELVCALAGLAL
jgi:hypothetical protein